MTTADLPIPRLPVFGWDACRGGRAAPQGCMLDLPNCHLTTSGRASITLALEVLGLRPGDGVLLPTYHCPTMVAPAATLGLRPVFYRLDATGAPDLDRIDRQDLSGVRALLAARYFGLPQPMTRLRAWCDQRGVALIEDCAHALFGHHEGAPNGSWGDIAIGSLTKFFPVSEGGCIVLNRGATLPPLARAGLVHQLKGWVDILEDGARHGRLGLPGKGLSAALTWGRGLRAGSAAAAPAAGASTGPTATADPIALGHAIDLPLAHRQPAAACRWVARGLPRSRIAAARRANYRALALRLSGHRGLHPLVPTLADGTVPYVFPLWTDRPDPGYQQLRSSRIPVFRWDQPWPGLPTLGGDYGRQWSHHVIQVACHQDLTAGDLDRIAEQLLLVYAQPD